MARKTTVQFGSPRPTRRHYKPRLQLTVNSYAQFNTPLRKSSKWYKYQITKRTTISKSRLDKYHLKFENQSTLREIKTLIRKRTIK